MNEKARELEIQACKTFVCPNMGLINQKGKILELKDSTIERAKNMATEYFRKTYREPRYLSSRYMLPAFMYIASVLEDDKRNQTQISNLFSVTTPTMKKWCKDILNTLNIEMSFSNERGLVKTNVLIDEIEKNGKTLSLKKKTIETAKKLILLYFDSDNENENKYLPYSKALLSGILYTASFIENDYRSQHDIFEVSGVSEGVISRWHNNILKKLKMKLVVHHGRVLSILKREDDGW